MLVHCCVNPLLAFTGPTSNSHRNGFLNVSVLKIIWVGLSDLFSTRLYALQVKTQYKYTLTMQIVTELETRTSTLPDLFCLSQKLEIQYQINGFTRYL